MSQLPGLEEEETLPLLREFEDLAQLRDFETLADLELPGAEASFGGSFASATSSAARLPALLDLDRLQELEVSQLPGLEEELETEPLLREFGELATGALAAGELASEDLAGWTRRFTLLHGDYSRAARTCIAIMA